MFSLSSEAENVNFYRFNSVISVYKRLSISKVKRIQYCYYNSMEHLNEGPLSFSLGEFFISAEYAYQ